MNNLAIVIGEENLDNAFRKYIQKFKFQSASLSDLINIAEKISGKNLKPFVNEWVYSKKLLDFRISDLKSEKDSDGKFDNKILIKNDGEINEPAKLELTTVSGTKIQTICNNFANGNSTVNVKTNEKIISAEVNPDLPSYDAFRPDNIYPRQYKFSFLTAAPSLTKNHFFYYPSITYGLTDGTRIGVWLTNSAPLLNIINRNLLPVEFRTGFLYGIKSKRVGYHLDFLTSIGMPNHYWQWGVLSEDFRGTENYGLNLKYILFKDLNHYRLHQFELNINRMLIYDLSYYDPKDFSVGTNTSLQISLQKILPGLKETAVIETGYKLLDGKYSYSRVNVEYNNTSSKFELRLNYRLFAGILRGNYPIYKSIFLSGSVFPEQPAYWFVDPDRKVSTQENLHTIGDANLIGYIGQHTSGKNGFGINVRLIYPRYKFVNLFFDTGNVWNDKFDTLKFDTGLGLDFSIIKIDFPLFINKPLPEQKNFDFRWLLEFNFGI